MINGIIKTSFVDYPKKISYVIFMGGCNMHCPFCHNKTIVEKTSETYEIEEVLKELEERKNFIETVTITGGEPTIQGEKLIDLIKQIKALGYLVKLDTNGTNPNILSKIIKENILDYIAMDIKNTFDKYEETCGVKTNIENIKKSIKIIENSDICYEFRTTINKSMHSIDDIKEIVSYIKDKNNFFLQPYKYSKEQLVDENYESYTNGEILEISKKLDLKAKI